MMEKVSGIGGVFFRSSSPGELADWYEINLGVKKTPESYDEKSWWQETGPTVFAPFDLDTDFLDDPEGNRIELWEPAGEDLTPEA